MLGVNERIRDHFFWWCGTINNQDKLDEWPFLQDYIHDWAHRIAIDFCGGDFADYASALPLIYSEYAEKPSRLDLPAINDRPKVERRPSGLIELSRHSAECFSRFWWNQQVFERRIPCSCST